MKNWMILQPHCRLFPPGALLWGGGTTHRASPKPTGLVLKKIKLFRPLPYTPFSTPSPLPRRGGVHPVRSAGRTPSKEGVGMG